MTTAKWVTLPVLVVSCCLAATNLSVNKDMKLSLKIVPSSYQAEFGPVINIHHEMFVVTTNATDSDLIVWDEECSWGYYSLSFEILFADGMGFTISKKTRNWTIDGPNPFIVEPQNHYVSSVRFADEKWQGFPQQWDGQKVKMRAVFEIKPDEEAKKLGVWNGKVESDWIEVSLHK